MTREQMLDQLLEIKQQRLSLSYKDMTFESYLDETIKIVASDVPDSVASMALLDVIERTKTYMDNKDAAMPRKSKFQWWVSNGWWIFSIVEGLMLMIIAYLYFFQRDIFNSLP